MSLLTGEPRQRLDLGFCWTHFKTDEVLQDWSEDSGELKMLTLGSPVVPSHCGHMLAPQEEGQGSISFDLMFSVGSG